MQRYCHDPTVCAIERLKQRLLLEFRSIKVGNLLSSLARAEQLSVTALDVRRRTTNDRCAYEVRACLSFSGGGNARRGHKGRLFSPTCMASYHLGVNHVPVPVSL